MKYLFGLLLVALISCSVPDNQSAKESCDFSICESGRVVTDTIVNQSGVLRIKDAFFYIEVTGYSPLPDTLFLSCLENEIDMPVLGNYVQFSGLVKDPCSDEISSSKDSLFLQKIESIDPKITDTCDKDIIFEGYDIDKNDDNLSIEHLSVSGGCLSVLVSYRGSCDEIPDLSLVSSNEVLFGQPLLKVNLQGEIKDNCDRENYAVLKYNLEPIWEDLFYGNISEAALFFQSQGSLKVTFSRF